MQIFLRSLTGQSVALEVNGSDGVLALKNAVEQSQGVPAAEQQLIYGGVSLDDEQTLEFYSIQEEATINLVLGLNGGGKKRKKAVLKYYKVDGDGKVTKLRKECPHDMCGP